MSNKVSFIIQLKDQFGRVAQKVTNQFQQIKRNADEAGRSVKKFTSNSAANLHKYRKEMGLTGAAMTAAITVPMAIASNQMINSASDAEETANKFKEVFKGINGEANAAVNALKSNYKLAGSTAQTLLSDTGDLLVGLGLTRKEALAMSQSVVQLSTDVASFKNVEGGTERAAIALTKALLGEREMLKETFKTAVLEEEVKKRAAVFMMKNRKLTEQQAKAMATLAIVTERNKDAIGDFARTQGGYANISRISQEQTKELYESFGKLLLPMAVKIKKVFIDVVHWVNALSPANKRLVIILGALVAIGGPLLILLAGIAAAAAVITLPMLAMGAAVAALVVAGSLLAANWKEVVEGGQMIWGDFVSFISSICSQIAGFFSSMWSGIKSGFTSFINFGINSINSLLGPLNFVAEKLGMGTIRINNLSTAPATSPIGQAGGTIDGNITVSASPGTSVRETRMRSRGRNMNVGLNMAVAP